MGKTTFSGPVISKAGFQTGVAGTAIKGILKGVVSVIVPALAASASGTVTVTIAGVAVGDVVMISPLDSAMEVDLLVAGSWVSAVDSVKIRLSNNDAANAATGSTANWSYVVIQS